MDYSPLGSSHHGILQPRILEQVAMPFSRGSSWPRDRTQVSCTAGRFFPVWDTRVTPTTAWQLPICLQAPQHWVLAQPVHCPSSTANLMFPNKNLRLSPLPKKKKCSVVLMFFQVWPKISIISPLLQPLCSVPLPFPVNLISIPTFLPSFFQRPISAQGIPPTSPTQYHSPSGVQHKSWLSNKP